jgi:hypothetical protein
MKCTNRHNLPPEVYDALVKNRYSGDEEGTVDKTDYSISAIIAPTQQTILRRRYPGCASEDAIDRVWSLFGSIAHALLEEHGSEGSIVEKRFYLKVSGLMISGQIDNYKDRKITDYKVTSAVKIKMKSFDDWAAQLNAYSYILEENGLPVDSIRIVTIIRDWQEREAERDKAYPQAPILILPFIKWQRDVRKRYVETRVKALIIADKLQDEDLPFCTDNERWYKFISWAVVKEGAARATKVFYAESDEDAARSLAKEKGEGYIVERRMTIPRRCMRYCDVSEKCTQHKVYLDKMKKEETNGQVEQA